MFPLVNSTLAAISVSFSKLPGPRRKQCSVGRQKETIKKRRRRKRTRRRSHCDSAQIAVRLRLRRGRRSERRSERMEGARRGATGSSVPSLTVRDEQREPEKKYNTCILIFLNVSPSWRTSDSSCCLPVEGGLEELNNRKTKTCSALSASAESVCVHAAGFGLFL